MRLSLLLLEEINTWKRSVFMIERLCNKRIVNKEIIVFFWKLVMLITNDALKLCYINKEENDTLFVM